MSINTKRLQGVCALAGTTVKLPSFEIKEMSRNGNLAVVSIDNAPDLENSKHLMVVYATDALNTGMVFNDSTRRVMQKLGQTPILYETGVFSVAVKNKNAARMKAFAVDLNGRRQGHCKRWRSLSPRGYGETARRPGTLFRNRRKMRIDACKIKSRFYLITA